MNWLKKLMPLIPTKLLKTDYNAKINEIKREIGRISGLVTTTLNAGKNEIPYVSYLVKQQIMLEK